MIPHILSSCHQGLGHQVRVSTLNLTSFWATAGDSVMQGLRVTLSVSPPRIPGLVATIQDAARASARAASAPSISAASSPAIGLSLLSPVKEEPSDWRSSRRLKGKVSSPFLDQMPSGGSERGTHLRPMRSGEGVGDAVPRNLIPTLRCVPSLKYCVTSFPLSAAPDCNIASTLTFARKTWLA